jgi:hypothetical protein
VGGHYVDHWHHGTFVFVDNQPFGAASLQDESDWEGFLFVRRQRELGAGIVSLRKIILIL